MGDPDRPAAPADFRPPTTAPSSNHPMQTQKLKLKAELKYTIDRANDAIDKCDAFNWANLAQVLTQLIAMIQLLVTLFTSQSPTPKPPDPPPVV
jgi:hypothetical protein